MKRVQSARAITLLCQRCHGDLRVVHAKYAADDEWQCLDCGAVWRYETWGWELYMEGPRDGETTRRRLRSE